MSYGEIVGEGLADNLALGVDVPCINSIGVGIPEPLHVAGFVDEVGSGARSVKSDDVALGVHPVIHGHAVGKPCERAVVKEKTVHAAGLVAIVDAAYEIALRVDGAGNDAVGK